MMKSIIIKWLYNHAATDDDDDDDEETMAGLTMFKKQ